MNSLNEDHQVGERRAGNDGNPVIQTAVDALRAFGGELFRHEAVKLLPMWAHYRQLTSREISAILARIPADAAGINPPGQLDAAADAGQANSGPGWPMTGAGQEGATPAEVEWWQP